MTDANTKSRKNYLHTCMLVFHHDMIQNKYIYVGILENMPQNEIYFSNLLNMEIKTPHRNKTSKKNKSNIDTTLTPEDEEYLMEKNKLDYQLYNFSQNYLLTQVS